VSAALVWLGAGALGGVGAVARYALDRAIAGRTAGGLPWGTLAVNVAGSLALGVLVGLGVDGDARLIAAGGLIGSFTTFSTWMLETQRLAEEGEGRGALANVALSLLLGLGAAAAGWGLGSLA
jgi:CrcB protein